MVESLLYSVVTVTCGNRLIASTAVKYCVGESRSMALFNVAEKGGGNLHANRIFGRTLLYQQPKAS